MRVADHCGMFTSQREINAMLDLVKEKTKRIDSASSGLIPMGKEQRLIG